MIDLATSTLPSFQHCWRNQFRDAFVLQNLGFNSHDVKTMKQYSKLVFQTEDLELWRSPECPPSLAFEAHDEDISVKQSPLGHRDPKWVKCPLLAWKLNSLEGSP